MADALTDCELQSLRNMGNEAERAADEIDRLRATLAQAMTERGRALTVGDDLEQENERLRAALSVQGEPQPAEAALKQARWEGIQSVQIQTAEIVRAALELLDAAGDTFPPERLAAFQRVFGAAPAAPAGWQWVPVEPTEAMLVAMVEAWQQADKDECLWEYRAALAAAPGAQGGAS